MRARWFVCVGVCLFACWRVWLLSCLPVCLCVCSFGGHLFVCLLVCLRFVCLFVSIACLRSSVKARLLDCLID